MQSKTVPISIQDIAAMNDKAEPTYRLDDHAYLRWTPEPTIGQPCLV